MRDHLHILTEQLTLKEEASRIEWQGDSWRLRVVNLRLPDGSTLEKEVIDHTGSVVVVPFQGDQILMIRQYRLSLGETILELPAGTREEGEEWMACAQRELQEEAGCRAEKWQPLGKIWPAPGLTNELMAVYLAQELSADPLPADADEQIEVVSLPIQKVVTMALDGRLQDAKSIVAILRAIAYLELERSSETDP